MIGLAAAGAAAVAGCCEPKLPNRVNHTLSSPYDIYGLGRVAFVELRDESGYPRMTEDMALALTQALQERGLFRVELIRERSPLRDMLPLDRLGMLTLKDLRHIRETLQCDAVLLGKVSHFRPYPHMQITLLVVLLDLRDGKTVWAVDDSWDTTDGYTEGRVKMFFNKHMRSGYKPATWELVLRSPKMFAKFVAYDMVETLPVGGVVAAGETAEQAGP
jgi:hypothetical protein